MKQHDIDLDLSRPQVMAILNVTPDSFFAGSRMPDATHVERRVKEAAAEGASIIDVGGYSSRPGADEVPVDEEWRRVELGIGAVRRLAPGVLIRSIPSAAKSPPVRSKNSVRSSSTTSPPGNSTRRCPPRPRAAACPTSPCT